MSSPEMDEDVEAVLASNRGLVVAAAGCGKTELLAKTVADTRSGRQLVLTHTHAGVAALKRRFDKFRIPSSRYQLDTIAGWSLRLASAYPHASGLTSADPAMPAWDQVYPAAAQVLRSLLGCTIARQSYNGVLVDEYQDCSQAQHTIVSTLADIVPVRVVGDPLQAVFGFRNDPLISWEDVQLYFAPIRELSTPFRWVSHNPQLGAWLSSAREQLLTSGTLTIAPSDPVRWTPWSEAAELDVCRAWPDDQAIVAIKRWPRGANGTIALATRLAGRFPVVEAFDDPDLPSLAGRWPSLSGQQLVRELLDYVRDRMVKVGPELDGLVTAISTGKDTARFTKHRAHCGRLEAVASQPTPQNLLALLAGFRAERGWTVYRPDGIHQLRAALEECEALAQMPEAVAMVRTRARHRGRLVPRRTLGTTLLVKGLEFDNALVLNADELSTRELYVAITRGSRSLHVMSATRTLRPSN